MAWYMQQERQQTYQKRRKRHCPALLVWLVVIVVLSMIAVLFVVNCHENTADRVRQISYPHKYREYVNKAANDYRLPPSLIYAVIRTESGFDPEAESPVGAKGLMQLMPSSFEWVMSLRGESGKYTEKDLFDPAVNIDYGSYLLRYFYDYYNEERCAVAAYNAGFVVSEWLSNPNLSFDGVTLTQIPYPETAEYVERVESAKAVYIELYYSS